MQELNLPKDIEPQSIEAAIYYGLCGQSRDEAAWQLLIADGASDRDIKQRLREQLGKRGVMSSDHGMIFSLNITPKLALWFGSYGGGEPTLEDQMLLDKIRATLEIPHPKADHPESTNFPPIPLDVIRVDGGTQQRVAMDQQTIDDYVDALKRGDPVPPLIVFFDGTDYWLADGFYRHRAAELAELVDFQCDIREGTQRDAILFSCSVNTAHGKQRTLGDRRKAIETMLLDPEWAKWSNRAIANHCKVNEITVRRAREALSATLPQMPAADTRKVVRGGTEYEMSTKQIGGAQQDEAAVTAWQKEQVKEAVVEADAGDFVTDEAADVAAAVTETEPEPASASSPAEAEIVAEGHALSDLLMLLKKTPAGHDLSVLIGMGFSIVMIEKAAADRLIEKTLLGVCTYTWTTTDVYEAIGEAKENRLSLSQFATLGCQAATVNNAIAEGRIRRERNGDFVRSTPPPVAPKKAASAAPAAAPAAPTLTELLGERDLFITYQYLGDMPGDVIVTVRVGADAKDTAMDTVEAAKVKHANPRVQEMIAERIAEDKRKEREKKRSSSTSAPAKSGAKPTVKATAKSPKATPPKKPKAPATKTGAKAKK